MSVATLELPALSDRYDVEPCNEFLKFTTPDSRSAMSIGVDRENNVIRGYEVAQLGPFRNPQRGEFNLDSLKRIVELGNAAPDNGLKVRFAHPSLSGDGVGTFLGRARNFRLEGGRVVRGDMFIDDTALETPPKGGRPLGEYVMHLAETDPAAFATSLHAPSDKLWRRDENGRRLTDDEGNELGPIWMPRALHASDVVDTGEATSGFLSFGGNVENLRDEHLYRAHEMLNNLFAGKPRDVVRSRLLGFLDSYLATLPPSNEEDDMSQEQLAQLAAQQKATDEALQALTGNIGTLTEALSAITTSLNEDRDARKAAADELAAEKRASKINLLCSRAGVTGKEVQEFIDGQLSSSQVAEVLFEKLAATRQLSGDAGDGDDANLDTKLKREYAENRVHHNKLGVTEEQYIAFRKQELAAEKGETEGLDLGQQRFDEIAAHHRKQLAGSAA